MFIDKVKKWWYDEDVQNIKRRVREMKIVNLTSHPVTFDEVGTIPSNGVSSLREEVIQLDEMYLDKEVALPLVREVLLDVVGLPDPDSDTYYVISFSIVKGSQSSDVLAINKVSEKKHSFIVSAKSLARIK